MVTSDDPAPRPSETWRKDLSGRQIFSLVALVQDHCKLIIDVINKSFSMYELKADPAETRNLIEDRTEDTDVIFRRLGGYLHG